MSKENILPEGYILQSGVRSYKIERVLGKGGFGITYLASGILHEGNISVKVFFAVKEHFVSSMCERDPETSRVVYSNPVRETVENSRKDFISEALRLQKVGIKHNNIVKVNEVFEANGTAYYIMEYLDGESLRKHVAGKGRLSEDETRQLLAPVVDAVKYLHSNRMTHLDIKPDNIMLTHNHDGSVRTVLIDFGLSKHYDNDGSPTSTINTLGCSDGYSPIEQYAGISTFSPESDYYALGATIWHCLTGQEPKRSIDTNPDELISLLPAEVSRPTREGLRQALQMSKSQRRMDLYLKENVGAPPVPPVNVPPRKNANNQGQNPPRREEVKMPSQKETVAIDSPVAKSGGRKWLWWLIGIFVASLIIGIIVFCVMDSDEEKYEISGDLPLYEQAQKLYENNQKKIDSFNTLLHERYYQYGDSLSEAQFAQYSEDIQNFLATQGNMFLERAYDILSRLQNRTEDYSNLSPSYANLYQDFSTMINDFMLWSVDIDSKYIRLRDDLSPIFYPEQTQREITREFDDDYDYYGYGDSVITIIDSLAYYAPE